MSSEPPTAPGPRSGVASAALLSTVGIGVQGAAKLILTVVIGRVFGTEALGQSSALLSLAVFAALLWPSAAGNTASRSLAIAMRNGRSDTAVNRRLGGSMLLASVVLAALTVPVAIAWGNGPGTVLGGVSVVVGYGLYVYARGAQLGHDRPRRVAVWDALTSTLTLALLVLACVTRAEPVVLLPLGIGYTVFAVACWPRGTAGTAGQQPTRGVLRFAAWNVLAGLTTNGLLQLAMITAQVSASPRDAGVYAAAFSLATPASMVGQAVAQVVVPAFAHRAEESTLRSPGAWRFVAGFSAATAVLFGLVALLADWFLPLFYPGEGVAAVADLPFLVLGVWVFTVSLVPAALLLAAGRSRQVALASVTGFVVGVVLMAVLAPTTGVAAGSAGFLVGSAVNLVAVVVLGLRRPTAPGRDPGASALDGLVAHPEHAREGGPADRDDDHRE
ncbi:oligosaccharide flippase family protein [Curtobacterium sp. DN_7.5]|uniref:lipopolysaccharide biosynthesis protein n=1 Tax=Curtobacterium sp. DN_7.5 TaxID=3049047 RepID=UPI001F59B6EF|nr:oligosaccharide flippase family protein [Curtobacterium sp. DN_7.5]